MPANTTRIAPCVGGCGKQLECKPLGRDRSCLDCRKKQKQGYRKAYYAKNRERDLEASNAWHAANRERSLSAAKAWKAANPDRVREYKRRRLRDSPAEVLNNRMRSAINQRVRTGKGGRSWRDVVGYGPEELMAHLERQFVKGMMWDNVGEWHIDHIVPLSSFAFDSVDDPEFRRAWALPNLRPLWAAENKSKYAKRTHLI